MGGRGKRFRGTGGPLGYIAFWQFMAFLLLIGLIWADVVLDFPDLFFRSPAGRANVDRACLLTAGVIVVGFITIAHAYAQQRRVLKGFIKICSYCRRVQVDEEVWRQMEAFLEDRTLAEFSHGVCPECCRRVLGEEAPRPEPARVDAPRPVA